ncbi:carboxypeptidase regulatory-like domain-containing protein [Luteolibacter sp.]|uniref:M56 family metallopeptidase n=1 Tax=Luteolibacter sp. TaxID=1962973 RepID=UPI0032653F31
METIWLASRDAAVLALAIVTVIKLVGHRMPVGWRHAVWLLVAARLLMPVLPASSLSWQRVLHLPQSSTEAEVREARIPVPESNDEISLPTLSTSTLPVSATESLPILTNEKPRTGKPPAVSPTVWDIVAGVWIAGVIGLLCVGTTMTWSFQRRVRRLMRSHPKTGDMETGLEAIGRQFGWKRLPSVQVTEAVDAPALFGLLWPRILMPPAVLDRLSESELRLVLLHELGHWKRRDLLVNFALALLQAVHWFNPFVWWAFHRTRLESERATDDWVLRRAGAAQVTDYGEMLLRLLDPGAKPRVVFSGVVSVVESHGDLRQRMTAIGRFTGKRSGLAVAASVALLMALAAVGLTQPPAPPSVSGKVTKERNTENLTGGTFICQVNTKENIPVSGAEVYMEVFSQIDGDALEKIRLAGKTNDVGEVEIRSEFLGARHATVSLFARHPHAGFGATSSGATQINSRIILNISEGLALRLHVQNNEGKPVSGMRLQVESVQNPSYSASKADDNEHFSGQVPTLPEGFWNAVTDSGGRCAIKGLPPGSFYVDHGDPRYAQIPGRHDYGLQFKLEPASPEIEIELQPAATVSGVVRLPDGTPVAGAEVQILEQNRYKHGGSWAETVTDDDGIYHLQRLLPSEYTLSVVLNDELKEGWTMNPVDLSLAPSEQKEGLSITLEKGGWVSGKVTLGDTGEPVSDLIVGIITPGVRSSLSSWSTKTDDNGIFRKRVPPGKRKVYLAGMLPEGYTTEAADRSELESTLQVKAGEEYSADFVIPRNTNISGVVLNPSGEPVAGATVTCFDPPDRMSAPQTVTTDKEGRFSFNCPVGTENAELLAVLGDMVSASGVKYPLSQDARLELKTNGFATASGRVVDQDGSPLEGVLIRCFGRKLQGAPSKFRTDVDGRYNATQLEPGKLVGFQASKDGYGEDRAQADLEAGKAATVETIILPKAISSVAGIVLDFKGNPIPSAKVGASGYLQPDGAEVSTDKDGKFELHGLVEGWLNVTAADDVMIRGSGRIKNIRTRTGRNDLVLKIPEVPVVGKLEKLVDLVGKPAPPLKAQDWLHSDPLTEIQPGKVRIISFVGLDRPLNFFSNTLPPLQKFREEHPEKELEIIVVHGAWPKEEVVEILAKDYPDFKLPIAIEPVEGAMSKEFGVQHWLYVVIDQKGTVAFQSRNDLDKVTEKVQSLLEKK